MNIYIYTYIRRFNFSIISSVALLKRQKFQFSLLFVQFFRKNATLIATEKFVTLAFL